MSECKIPFSRSGIYKRKINKVILPPNLQRAQQMQCIKGRQREGPSSPPGLRSFSPVADSQVLQQVHRGTLLPAGPWFKMPRSLIVPHFQGPFLWELLGTRASLCLLHLPTSHTQPPSPGVNRPRMAAFVSRSCML